MIGSVKIEVGGAEYSARLTTAAMLRVEAATGKPLGALLGSLGDGLSIGFIVELFAACLNDGEGVKKSEALDLIDQAGGALAMMVYVDPLIAAAMPDQGGGKGKAGKLKPVAPKG